MRRLLFRALRLANVNLDTYTHIDTHRYTQHFTTVLQKRCLAGKSRMK